MVKTFRLVHSMEEFILFIFILRQFKKNPIFNSAILRKMENSNWCEKTNTKSIKYKMLNFKNRSSLEENNQNSRDAYSALSHSCNT